MSRQAVKQDAFRVEVPTPYFRICGVPYAGGVRTVDLCTTLLESRTQDEHAEHAAKARQDEFRACPAPFHYALFRTLYSHRAGSQKEGIEQVRLCLSAAFDEGLLATLSRVRWKSQGLDEVVHDYGLRSERIVRAILVGPDGYVGDRVTGAKTYVQKLLGTDDGVKKINSVFEWCVGESVLAYRMNEIPPRDDERVVALGVYDDGRFNLFADVVIGVSRPALGVRVVEKNFSS